MGHISSVAHITFANHPTHGLRNLMKIVVADDLPASAVDLLRAESGWEVDVRSGRSLSALATDLAEADALLVRSATKVTADLLAAAPRLRVVARAGTGVDNVDVGAASARGVLVVNSPGANSISVAEHACGMTSASYSSTEQTPATPVCSRFPMRSR